MNTEMNRLSVVALLCCLQGAVGCIGRCADEFEVGRTYGVTLVELYDENSRFPFDPLKAYYSGSVRPHPSCSGFDGLVAGVEIEIKATGERDDGHCIRLFGAASRLPPQVTITQPPIHGPIGTLGPTLISVVQPAKVGECEGLWYLRLQGFQGSRGGSSFEESVPGEPPRVILNREFRPMKGTCQTCIDAFVVRLERR